MYFMDINEKKILRLRVLFLILLILLKVGSSISFHENAPGKCHRVFPMAPCSPQGIRSNLLIPTIIQNKLKRKFLHTSVKIVMSYLFIFRLAAYNHEICKYIRIVNLTRMHASLICFSVPKILIFIDPRT